MKRKQSLTDSFHDRSPFLILEFAFDFKDIIELSSNTVLKDEIYINLISKHAIKLNQINMAEIGLNNNFSGKLILEFLLPYCLLLYYFQSNN